VAAAKAGGRVECCFHRALPPRHTITLDERIPYGKGGAHTERAAPTGDSTKVDRRSGTQSCQRTGGFPCGQSPLMDKARLPSDSPRQAAHCLFDNERFEHKATNCCVVPQYSIPEHCCHGKLHTLHVPMAPRQSTGWQRADSVNACPQQLLQTRLAYNANRGGHLPGLRQQAFYDPLYTVGLDGRSVEFSRSSINTSSI
jgi:hypothetical protein